MAMGSRDRDAGAASSALGRVFVPVGIYRNVLPGAGTYSFDAVTGDAQGIVARPASQLVVPRDGRIVGTYAEIVGTGFALSGYFVVDRDDASKSWAAVRL